MTVSVTDLLAMVIGNGDGSMVQVAVVGAPAQGEKEIVPVKVGVTVREKVAVWPAVTDCELAPAVAGMMVRASAWIDPVNAMV